MPNRMEFPELLASAYKSLYFNTFRDMNDAESVCFMLSIARRLSRNVSVQEALLRYEATMWDTV